MLNWLSIKVWMWIAGVVGAAFLATAGGWYVRGIQLKDARADIKSLEVDVETAKRTIAGQQAALKECSDRTDALKAEGVKRQIAAEAALLRAQQEARRYQEANKRRDAALKAPTPSGAGCREAVSSLRAGLPK